MLVGSVVGGIVSDAFGRKTCMFCNCALLVRIDQRSLAMHYNIYLLISFDCKCVRPYLRPHRATMWDRLCSFCAYSYEFVILRMQRSLISLKETIHLLSLSIISRLLLASRHRSLTVFQYSASSVSLSGFHWSHSCYLLMYLQLNSLVQGDVRWGVKSITCSGHQVTAPLL